MRPLSDLASVQQKLRDGIAKGYWTIEDLDAPPPGFIGDPQKYRNLLRDGPLVIEKVQVIDDKDLPPMPNGYTPAEELDLPITL